MGVVQSIATRVKKNYNSYLYSIAKKKNNKVSYRLLFYVSNLTWLGNLSE